MITSKILKNDKGVAIGVVLGSIIILTGIIANFTYEMGINKIKTYNIEDRSKAKLTAEAGVRFAMTRLKLYRELFNFVEKNDSVKEFVKQETLNLIWNFPFVYPVPVQETMNKIQKDAIGEFIESTIIEGRMNLTITNISNKMNLNLLRVRLVANEDDLAEDRKKEKEGDDYVEKDENLSPENQLFELLTNAIENKSNSDEDFNSKYYGFEVNPLVNELKYYVSDPESLEDAGGVQSNFDDKDITAKNAPLTSLSEVYTLPSWDDELTKLILQEYTVHGALMIDLNKVTDKQLKLLIPDITKEDIEEFFKYKDDPEDPKYFNTLDDFKKYWVGQANVISTEDFDNRFNNYERQGLKFGPAASLFMVKSTGVYGRAELNITAYVVMPVKPEPIYVEPEPVDPNDPNNQTNQTNQASNDPNDPNNNNNDPNDPNKEPERKPIELLKPRIVEITVS